MTIKNQSVEQPFTPVKTEKKTESENGQWGRAWNVDLFSFLSCVLLLLFSPLLVFFFYITAFHFNCSLVSAANFLFSKALSWEEIARLLPSFSMKALMIFGIWFGLQVFLALIPDMLHRFLPSYVGGKELGATTPSGLRLPYNINGMQAWLVSHILFFAGAFWFGWFSPSIIFDNWGGLLLICNIVGFSVAIFAYVKSLYFPSHPQDRKFSNSPLYDFFMGVELNPRIGPIDFKLFFNGRPGIVAWTLINISFAFAQYQQYGYVTNSMIIVNVLQGLYVLYFFWKESWYLKTIDIHHDHFGWYLAWGDSVWLPYMYTLQGLYLVFNPIELSLGYALFVLSLGLAGFWIFLSSNNQKDYFRRNNGNVNIWGKKPNYIECEYQTKDGEIRRNKLLTSGWWGLARHTNYTGDLILSLAYSLACGFDSLFPYFYFIFISILLIHRCIRDEHRCSHKYGKTWNEYCSQVRYRLIPGVF